MEKKKHDKNCIVCGEHFTSVRYDALYCSRYCYRKDYRKKNPRAKKIRKERVKKYTKEELKEFVKDKNKVQCSKCGKWKPRRDFYKHYGEMKLYNECKDCYGPKTPELEKIKADEVWRFLYRMKLKNWMASQYDIFVLIDIFDRVYPGSPLKDGIEGNFDKLETYFSKITWRLVKWLRRQDDIQNDKSYHKIYYRKNRDKIKAYQEANKEKLKEYRKIYYREYRRNKKMLE